MLYSTAYFTISCELGMDVLVQQCKAVLMLSLTISIRYPLCRSCTNVLIRVIQQRARNWGEAVGVSTIPPSPPESPPTTESKGVTQLNIDAKPFIPSGEFQIQQPVSNVGEWDSNVHIIIKWQSCGACIVKLLCKLHRRWVTTWLCFIVIVRMLSLYLQRSGMSLKHIPLMKECTFLCLYYYDFDCIRVLELMSMSL